MLTQLISAFYPLNCVCCSAPLTKQEERVCLSCKTNFGIYSDFNAAGNEIEQLFWGKAQVEFATALYLFLKGENLQKIIHLFKYNQKKSLALKMGELLGSELKKTNFLITVDVITYVPMHKKKIKKRGYNQAKILAQGVAKNLRLPVISAIERIKNTKSQTEKNVIQRYINSVEKFNGKVISNYQHILIIDDVITTGATLVECTNAIKKENPNIKISVVALAYRSLEV